MYFIQISQIHQTPFSVYNSEKFPFLLQRKILAKMPALYSNRQNYTYCETADGMFNGVVSWLLVTSKWVSTLDLETLKSGFALSSTRWHDSPLRVHTLES